MVKITGCLQKCLYLSIEFELCIHMSMLCIWQMTAPVTEGQFAYLSVLTGCGQMTELLTHVWPGL